MEFGKYFLGVFMILGGVLLNLLVIWAILNTSSGPTVAGMSMAGVIALLGMLGIVLGFENLQRE